MQASLENFLILTIQNCYISFNILLVPEIYILCLKNTYIQVSKYILYMRAQIMQFPFIAYCATQYTDKTLIFEESYE